MQCHWYIAALHSVAVKCYFFLEPGFQSFFIFIGPDSYRGTFVH
jgi:hypothetical protein